MSIASTAHRFIALSLIVLSKGAWAALQTTPFLAIHNTAQYTQLESMPYANTNAEKGGYISSSAMGAFDNLNSMNGKGSSVEGVNFLFDTLLSPSLDEPGVMYPLIAEKVTLDPKKTNFVIFHLNPKARFSNGDLLTAEDVKFSFDLYQSQANPGLQMYLSDLAKTEVLSAHQVKMSFKSGNNADMPMILAQMPIYSKRDWAHKDFRKITLVPILGSGPYVIEHIDAGRSISYKRNANYWAKDLAVNRGRYNFNRLKYVYYRSTEIAFEGFKAGQFTLYEEKKARNWVSAYNFPAFKAGLVVKYRSKHQRPIPTRSLIFNTRRTPFNDIQFRQALTYAYDFEWQNKALFYGQYQRLQSYFSNSVLEAKGEPSSAEQQVLNPLLSKLTKLQKTGVLGNWRYPVSDGSGFNRENLLKARQILLNAGYLYQNGRLVDQKDQPIHFEILIHQDNVQRILLPYIRNLKRLGIQVSLRQVDEAQYTERMRKTDFDMIMDEMPQSLTPSSEQAQLWGSQSADQPGNYNYAGIKNPAIDAVIHQIIHAPNREQLIVRTQVLDRLLRAGYYQIPMFGQSENWFAYWNMYHQPEVKPKLSTGIDYWWSDATEAKSVAQYLRKQ
ncbi:ABC transporter substrate-binding protein [Acinetobacter sp. ANC 5054]|uniref:extracellular solute-binding protein n=1 Tax=Acinetobacter sp. ANC 5054 TaxID=1977877 RepID=UPI000A33318F|nr:extracellular solute-binding protein [Acinetobacter sp. ANC 5054]OTG78463.1 ABC transporter substrate-binding protein [Acinetobacter sp. ANC 5054]